MSARLWDAWRKARLPIIYALVFLSHALMAAAAFVSSGWRSAVAVWRDIP